ncbi:M56 family metallopeptidase [Salegentibacter chungangensis]|uniref:M56 family metallopeptidase n=1 Tax=Salegentibacter chungangensis TaxID=1335724 RepID=A0ABW3NT79_9FLAO
MIEYLIKSTLCLLVLFVFYKLALEGEHMHKFKRFYLLGSLVLSLVLPIIGFTYHTGAVTAEADTGSQVVKSGSLVAENLVETTQFSDLMPYLIGIIYLAGLIFFGIRFFRNLREIFLRVKLNKQIRMPHYTNVLLKERLSPHSFLKYIFLNKTSYERREIEQEVLKHEEAHVRQRHSLDILIIEGLQVIFWFNPLYILYKSAMQMNHEFLADKAVVESSGHTLDYSKLLFNYSAGRHQGLTSSFNHSLIKKRILMISKPFSKKRLATRLSLLLPVLAVCILLFNNGITAKPLDNTPVTAGIHVDQQEPKELTIKIAGEQIWVNQEKVALEDFSRAINRATKGMTEEELRELKLNFNVQLKEGEEGRSFLQKFNREFLETRLSKVLGQDLFPPAPPAPPIPEEANVPAPPAPPAPAPKVKDVPRASEVKVTRRIEVIKESEENGAKEMTVVKMGENEDGASFKSIGDANFYFNGEKVSRQEAERLMKGKKDIRIEVKKIDDKKAEVQIHSDD